MSDDSVPSHLGGNGSGINATCERYSSTIGVRALSPLNFRQSPEHWQ